MIMTKKNGCKPGEIKAGKKCLSKKKVIKIIVHKGLVEEIKGLPRGYIAKIEDLDSKKGGEIFYHYTDGKNAWRKK